MRGGRGQVTAFFLIGLAVLFVFIIILLLRSALIARTSVRTTPQEYDAQLVKGYVEGCLDLATNEGFTTLGRQGGLLFASQGGLTPNDDPLTLNVSVLSPDGTPTQERVTVAFGLVNDSGFPFHPPFQGSNATEYKYPFPGIAFVDIAARERVWEPAYADGAFGQYSLPPLCDPAGENNGSGAGPRCPTLLFSLPTNASNAMQASLAAFIASHVRQCIDPAELSTRLGANVTLGQPNVTIEFTHSEALVTLDLPLNFATEGSALRMSSFSRHYQVRPVQLSWFAFNLLKRASKDPYFHINDSADYSSVPGYDGFVVTQQSLSSASVAGRQDIILISIADPLSKVDKATWFFQFLVQARPPVLDQIQNAAAKDNVQFAALAPDGDALKMIIEYYPLGEEVSRPAIIVPLSLDMDKRTWRGNLSGLIAGTYNASVNSTSSGLADWQVFTVSSS